jgi:4-amino-4-deoxy-L-arabinose transferase-like glycosyltransferase
MGRLVALIPRGNLMEEQVLARGGVPNGMYGNFLPADEGGLGTGHVLAGRLVRFATVLMGAVAVLCSYFIALWLTRRPEVVVLTTALMAFNPRNLVLSGAVSNDMAVACAAALTLLLATRVVTAERKPGLALIFLMGLSAGAALLTKYSGGAVIFAAIAALIGRMIQSRYSFRWLATNGAALATSWPGTR